MNDSPTTLPSLAKAGPLLYKYITRHNYKHKHKYKHRYKHKYKKKKTYKYYRRQWRTLIGADLHNVTTSNVAKSINQQCMQILPTQLDSSSSQSLKPIYRNTLSINQYSNIFRIFSSPMTTSNFCCSNI